MGDITARLLSAYIISRFDYCNSVLAGLPKSTTAPLQRVQNSAARLVKRLGPRVHISSALHDLHWPPVNFHITYKLWLIMHAAHNHRCPEYIRRLVTSTASILSRSRLRSATSNLYEVPKTGLKFGERAFSVVGPTPWNNLLEEITDIREINTLKSKLKTYLFTMAFTNI